MEAQAPDERVALLIVRVVLVEGRPSTLRARITEVRDVKSGEQLVRHVASTEAVEETVSVWLHEIAYGTASDTGQR
jgi:hypothetical protein